MTTRPRQVSGSPTDPVARSVNNVAQNPLLGAHEIEVTAEAGEQFVIAHGLGRPVQGYLCTYASQPIFGQFYEDLESDLGLDRNTHLVLEPAGSVETTRSITLRFLIW